jgi:hypothetical protein
MSRPAVTTSFRVSRLRRAICGAVGPHSRLTCMPSFAALTGKELDETYAYLNRIEANLGIKITRLNSEATFDHWLKVFGGYLTSPQMRWCTKLLKLKPFEASVGDDPVISYVGLRAYEDRIGYISTKENIRAVFPLKEHGIDYQGLVRLFQESGLGMPPYMA